MVVELEQPLGIGAEDRPLRRLVEERQVITMRGFETGAWFGVVAPVGTPTAIVQKINAALHDMNADAEAKARFVAAGAEYKGSTSQEFQEFLVAQDALWGRTLTDLGVKPE